MATRKYESKLREEQARDTRQRILEGAARIALFDVARVTHASVARSAGVSERTVYRHFPTVAELHAAFAEFQEQRIGDAYSEDLSIDDLPAMYEGWPERIDASIVDAFLRDQNAPAILTASRRKRYARLESALAEMIPDATPTQLRQLVIVFGALMSPEAFARGKKIFDLDVSDVVPGPAWAMRVLIESLRNGETPWA